MGVNFDPSTVCLCVADYAVFLGQFSTLHHFGIKGLHSFEKFYNVEAVVSFGRLTAFYVVLVPMEHIPSKPPHFAYIIVLFCTCGTFLQVH